MNTDIKHYPRSGAIASEKAAQSSGLEQLVCAVRASGALLLLCGVAYTGSVTLLGQALFPHQATGSLIEHNGKMVGANWVAQEFVSPGYFHSRPSAVSHDPTSTGGSNLAPSNPDLVERVRQDSLKIQSDYGVAASEIPVDMLSASGSGIDPHISPQAAVFQAERIAENRRIPLEVVMNLISFNTEAPQWGVFGQERVNVLRLNLALDQLESK